MKHLTMVLMIGTLLLGALTLLVPTAEASGGSCPGPTGWQLDVQRTGPTCEQAKTNLRNYLIYLVENACGPDNVVSYSIVIDPVCTCQGGTATATGDVYFCCGEDM